MQARGVTEKAYVEQCKGGAEPTAAAPAAKPAEAPAAAPPPRQATTTGSKTAKDCTAEWRADKAGMQARGVTEKAYVEQCKGGAAPAASAPAPRPTAAAPAPAAPPPQAGAVVFAEDRQGMHCRMESRQGGHASPWRHRKGLC